MKKKRHAVNEIFLHLVFVTKYRRDVFDDEMLVACEAFMRKVCDDMDVDLEEFNGESDHVHLLVKIPPTLAPSVLVNSLKGVSSRLLRKNFDERLKDKLWGDNFWSRSYFVGSSGGATLDVLRRYIASQDRPQ